ncbi:unnamed protein product [Paramecium primaurelia]|uniref:Tetratricopeptide repeat protein n=1 Tax=Paramecium primaurelia TaxID=5886 RepID=A0A8S1QGS3_PARPR|nr:unnamed protein product [Paramecium primaurelia]CAD8113608.1 unnamed protein product [Paramecium primaurelia]
MYLILPQLAHQFNYAAKKRQLNIVKCHLRLTQEAIQLLAIRELHYLIQIGLKKLLSVLTRPFLQDRIILQQIYQWELLQRKIICIYPYSIQKWKNEEAIETFDQLISLEPNNYQAFYQKGRSLINSGGFVEAIVSLNKALKLNSNVFSIWNSKGRLLLNMNRYEEAILCFKTLFQLNSNDNVAIEQIRETLESLNRIEEAIAFISQAVINNPQSHVSKFQMAKTLLRIGSFEEALIFSQQALSMQPQNQQYLQLYCKVVFMQQLSKGCLEQNEQGNCILLENIIIQKKTNISKKLLLLHLYRNVYQKYMNSIPNVDLIIKLLKQKIYLFNQQQYQD